jgi:hypothetical protein
MLDQKDGMRMIYNNVYMGDILKYSCDSEPVKDDKLKTTKYVKYTYTVDAMLFGDKHKIPTDFDASGQPLKNYLVEPGKDTISVSKIPAYADETADDILSLMKLRLLESRKSLFIFNSGFGNVLIQGDVASGNLDGDAGTSEGDSYLSEPMLKDYLEDIGAYTPPNNFSAHKRADEIPYGDSQSPSSSPEGVFKHRDIKFGPEPNILKWEPIAGRKSARVVFEISFYVKDCLAWPAYSKGGVLEDQYDSIGLMTNFLYSMDYDINDLGYQVRTINGQVEITNNTQIIHQNRGEDKKSFPRIAKSADDVRDSLLFKFECPNNFRRTSQKFNISEDRSILTFKITDSQIESQEAYPTGVVDIEVNHNVASEGIRPGGESGATGKLFTQWENTLSATITLVPEESYSKAFVIFSRIVLTRLAGATRGEYRSRRVTSTGIHEDKKTHVVDARVIMPAQITIDEKLYGHKQKFKFSFSWVLLAKSADEASTMLASTGLFSSVQKEYPSTLPNDKKSEADTDSTKQWKLWKQKVRGKDTYDNTSKSGEGTRGNSRLKDEPNKNVKDEDDGNNRTPMVNSYLKNELKGTLAEASSGTSKNIVLDTCTSAKASLADIAGQQNSAFQGVSNYAKNRDKISVTAIPMWNNSYGAEGSDKGYDVRSGADKGYSLTSYRTKLTLQTSSDDIQYQRQINPNGEYGSLYNEYDKYDISATNYEQDSRGRNQVTASAKMPEMTVGEHIDFRSKGSGSGTRTISRSQPNATATLIWSAKRLGGPMPPPQVTKIGGADVILIENKVESEIINSDLEVPLYKTTGVQLLSINGRPRGLALEVNGMPTARPT